MVCTIATGLILVSAITGALYHFCKTALYEKEDKDLIDPCEILNEKMVIPKRPPRKSQKNLKLDESLTSKMSKERCNTSNLTIPNDQIHTKVLTRAQLEKIPNKTTSINNEEKLNSSNSSLMCKNDVNLVSNDDELKHSSRTLSENINDYPEKSVMRKTLNVINEEERNETDNTIYLDLPVNLDSIKYRPVLTSTRTNISNELQDSDNEITIKKVYYLINEENNNEVQQNDVSQMITIAIRKNIKQNRHGNNDNASSSIRSDSNLERSCFKRKKKFKEILFSSSI